jgi:very-short-patch-repair endonuclease
VQIRKLLRGEGKRHFWRLKERSGLKTQGFWNHEVLQSMSDVLDKIKKSAEERKK